MKHTLLIFTLLAAAAFNCASAADTSSTITPDERRALDHLYRSMPLSDRLNYPEEYFLSMTRQALQARAEMPWGAAVPDSLFYYFVLPPRVNNENLDEFRTECYPALRDRVAGLSATEAILEVNHWLHEHVTYRPSDGRTSAPLATMCNGIGRCGEESVLGVAALRAIGIPARQVYTPRWAHTDDNHAWVEVWVDGRWHFLGACEPEPVLDKAWFNAPASRAMLVHAKVCGDYRGAEQVLSSRNHITEINVTPNYVATRPSTVRVVDAAGRPVAGLPVEFRLYNYAEFYPLATLVTDDDGTATLVTGHGDLLAWATDGNGLFGLTKIGDDNCPATLVLDYVVGTPYSFDLTVTPPAESPIPFEVTPEQIAENARRFAVEDSLRLSGEDARFYHEGLLADASAELERHLLLARGNWREIAAFIAAVPADRRDDAMAMLGVISEKDHRDAPAQALLGTLLATPPQPGSALYAEYVLNPRVAAERLTDYRTPLAHRRFSSATEVIAFINDSVNTLPPSANPYNVPIVPAMVDRNLTADPTSRDIYFVALCRTNSLPARVNPVDGHAQWHDGSRWVDATFSDAEVAAPSAIPTGCIAAIYDPQKYLSNPQYYRHFTLSDMNAGTPSLLEYPEEATYASLFDPALSVAPGYYLLTSGTRLADGSVMAHLDLFPVVEGDTVETALVIPEAGEQPSVIGNFDCEMLYTDADGDRRSILSTTGRGYFVLAILGPSDEPSNHALVELSQAAEMLNTWGRPLLVLRPGAAPEALNGIDNISFGTDADGSIAAALLSATESTLTTLPVIVVADSFGRIIFISQGYDTTLSAKLRRLLPAL